MHVKERLLRHQDITCNICGMHFTQSQNTAVNLEVQAIRKLLNNASYETVSGLELLHCRIVSFVRRTPRSFEYALKLLCKTRDESSEDTNVVICPTNCLACNEWLR